MRLLLLHLGDPSRDPRPKRFIEMFKDLGWMISVVSQTPAEHIDVNHHVPIPKTYISRNRLLSGTRRRAISLIRYTTRREKLRTKLNDIAYGIYEIDQELTVRDYDLILVEDLFLLPLAFRVKGRSRILFDAREFYPSQNEESLRWRLIERPERVRLCRTYLPMCDAILTVSPGLANRYQSDFGVTSIIFRSVPKSSTSNSSRRTEFPIRLVHHGVANPNRKLNTLIEIASRLGDRYSLDLYLVGDRRKIRRLQQAAKGSLNVNILEPVMFDEIISTIQQYDIGLCFLPDSTFNLRFSLPNKFFEYIHGGLVLAVGPSPDMVEVVDHFQCGVVAPEFSARSMADAIRSLNPESLDSLKRNSRLAATMLSFDAESDQLLSIVNGWFGSDH